MSSTNDRRDWARLAAFTRVTAQAHRARGQVEPNVIAQIDQLLAALETDFAAVGLDIADDDVIRAACYGAAFVLSVPDHNFAFAMLAMLAPDEAT